MGGQYEYYNGLCACPGTYSSGTGSQGGYYQYYKDYCICPDGSISLGMQDLEGNETSSYPVDVYNVLEEFVGVAATKTEYISVWNSDPDNQAVGVLTPGTGPFRFKLFLNPGQINPGYVIGETDDDAVGGIYGLEYGIQYE